MQVVAPTNPDEWAQAMRPLWDELKEKNPGSDKALEMLLADPVAPGASLSSAVVFGPPWSDGYVVDGGRSFCASSSNEPQAWAEEVGRFLFIWMVYLGATLATVRESHIRVTFLVDRMGERGEAFSLWLGRFVNLVCFVFVAWFGWQIAWSKRNAEF